MRHGKYRFIIGFLAVPIAFYAVLVISPFFQSFYIALTDWSGFTADKNFVGLGNFRRLVHDSLFWTSLWHNIILLLALPVVTLVLALFFAFMINVGGRRRKGATVAGVRGSAFYKVVFFFPQVLSIAIIGILWQFIFNPASGPINSVLDSVGITNTPNWLGSPDLALLCVIVVMVWSQVGFYVVLFSAGMGSVPHDIYEAVMIDGAGRATTFFRITLPLLRDTVATGWVYMGIMAMDSFAIVQIMTIPPGGPDDSTSVVPFYLYNTAFTKSQAGYATSMGVAMLVVTLVFAVLTLRLNRRERIEF